jgi:L-amino acid N-acyltransferase YncA
MRVRLASESDASPVREIYAPVVESTVISFETVAPSVAEMASRIAGHQDTHPWLIAEADTGVLGYAYAGAFSERAAYLWSVQTSVYVAAIARRQGVGRALYAALFRILRTQGYHCAFAGVTLPNEASVGLHETMSFTRVGVYRQVGWKFGAWHDVGWWQRTLPGVADDEVPEPPHQLGQLPARVVQAALDPDGS